MSRFPPLLLLLLLVPAAQAWSADATAAPSAGSAAPLRLVLLPLEAAEGAKDEAPGLTALLVSRLAESPRLTVSTEADVEAVREAGACVDGSCEDEASRASRARYVVTGRIDAFGSRYLLTLSLVDAERGRALSRPRIEVASREALPRAAVTLADQLLATLVPQADARPSPQDDSEPKKAPGAGSFLTGIRVNNSLISNLSSFNPGGDVELGYQFHPEWAVFAQVGITYVTSSQENTKGGLNLLPGVLGLRHYHNIERPLRPYWGLGLGVQLSFGEFGIFRQTGALPTVMGFVGLEYLFFGHLGVQLEASTNLAQATLGLADGGLGSGLNLDLNAGIAWHF